jgi:hypothetical protein
MQDGWVVRVEVCESFGDIEGDPQAFGPGQRRMLVVDDVEQGTTGNDLGHDAQMTTQQASRGATVERYH